MSVKAAVIVAAAATYEVSTWCLSTAASAVLANKLKGKGGVHMLNLSIEQFKAELAKKVVTPAVEVKQEEKQSVVTKAVNAVKSVAPVTRKTVEQNNEVVLNILAEHELEIQQLKQRATTLEKKARIKAPEEIRREYLDEMKEKMLARWAKEEAQQPSKEVRQEVVEEESDSTLVEVDQMLQQEEAPQEETKPVVAGRQMRVNFDKAKAQ